MLRITYTKVPRSVRIPSRATVYEARDVIAFSYYFKQLAIIFYIPTLLFRNFIRAKKVLLMHTAAIFASILACNCIFRRHASIAILSSCVTVGWFEGGTSWHEACALATKVVRYNHPRLQMFSYFLISRFIVASLKSSFLCH